MLAKIDIFCDTRQWKLNETVNETEIVPLNLTSILICGLMKVIIDVIGLCGNIISLIVLKKPNMKSAMTTILIGLTFFDSLLLFADISCFSLPTLLSSLWIFNIYTKILAPFLAPYAYPLINVGLTGSEYFTMFVTIERYLVVCWPFKVKKLCTQRNVQIISIILAIYSFILNIPRIFEHKAVKITNSNSNNSTLSAIIIGNNNTGNINSSSINSLQEFIGTFHYHYEVYVTEFGTHPMYKFIYLFLTWTITRFIFPFGVLLILNIFIWKRISMVNHFIRSRISSSTTSATKNKQKEFPITKMTFCIVAIFAACTIPYLFNRIQRGWLQLPPIPLMIYISTLALSFNSAINWFIYCIFSKKYRRNFLKVVYYNCPCIYRVLFKRFMVPVKVKRTNTNVRKHKRSHVVLCQANRAAVILMAAKPGHGQSLRMPTGRFNSKKLSIPTSIDEDDEYEQPLKLSSPIKPDDTCVHLKQVLHDSSSTTGVRTCPSNCPYCNKSVSL